MKLIIASDIHGSYKYTKKLEELIIKENPDKIVLLGDLYYHGPRNPLPEEYNCQKVADTLNKYSNKIIAVQGNCDAEVDQMISNFPLLKETSLTVSHHHFHFMHGHHLDKNNLLANTYYFVGHTHVYSLDGQILNPGSVSLPKENPEHTCFIYQDNTISLISLTDFHIIKERKLNE